MLICPVQSSHVGATRINDSLPTMLECLKRRSHELAVTQKYSYPSWRADLQNWWILVLDLRIFSDVSSYVFMVMPCLRNLDGPPFETVGQALDLALQTAQVHSSYGLNNLLTLTFTLLQTVEFMHKKGIAHG